MHFIHLFLVSFKVFFILNDDLGGEKAREVESLARGKAGDGLLFNVAGDLCHGNMLIRTKDQVTMDFV